MTWVFAAGYRGPPAPGASTYLTAWALDPVAALVVAVAAAGYLLAVRRVPGWPAGRTCCFLGLGLGSLAVVTMGWPGVYAHALFWAYALQITVLLAVTPALLALGQPIALANAAVPRLAGRLRRPLGRTPIRLLATPFVGPILVPVALTLVFFTGCLPATLRHYGLYEALHVGLLGVGFLSALPWAGSDLALSALTLGAGLFLAFLELLLDAIPGIVVRLRTDLLAPAYYLNLHRPWGPSPLRDQQLGGAILWFLGETLDLPVIGLLLLRWLQADEREARQVDHELDVLAALDAGARPADEPAADRTAPDAGAPPADEPAADRTAPDAGAPPADEQRSRPWWETNPEVFGDYRAELFRREARRRRPPDR